MYWPIWGISATFDWTWRANSSSTFSRSARIGSKICERASDVFSTRIPKTLSRAEQGVEIRRGSPGDLRRRFLVHVGQGGHDPGDVGRLVALPPVRDRREEGAVGLRQEAIQRHRADGVAQIRGLWKGQDARERDVEPERQACVAKRRRPRETVQDAAQAAFAGLPQDRDRVL